MTNIERFIEEIAKPENKVYKDAMRTKVYKEIAYIAKQLGIELKDEDLTEYARAKGDTSALNGGVITYSNYFVIS